ncbi:transcription elongation factor NusA [Thermosipho melanesiensis]|uniref:Transcription termination/antitermination protein NusA n=2 Tax=Thermosipho melanesiensis TaxID=46541 RepID=A6LMV8_THEM4|nr:transcription termination factor NusA [Thermosipho melanesiensis]ABR31259.1 NusA antitermination factor [Thermosipho melanesiensis BI429]APT74342.1 transcription elongation factor NusA [Thermosipho melanesiensis]OOC36282.1 transcription elongation factor NusA [Thermosipho melanesiensis]OOC37100.1 transcription elongation factor NusA [Thermosipho melanesiensis]OOC37852.1 transcription elongation factor NusA [Thermosipho melanesiensis]
MNLDFLQALEQLEEEKGIKVDEIIPIIEKALVSAYKKDFGGEKNVEITINRQTGEIELYQLLEVVDKVEKETTQISLEDALKISSNAKIGDTIRKRINVKKFGRIAAQTAKQVLIQRIREIEKEKQFEKYSELAGKITTAEVIRITKEWADIRIGKLETRLPKKEWIPGETIEPASLIKVYVKDVKKDKKGPKILVTRINEEFIKGLLELEVPEIESKVVEIVKIVREPGIRTKVAVKSNNPKVDPVGACIGEEGVRIAAILRELKGEKLDIIKWSDDPKELIASALQPANVVEVEILDPENKASRIIVPPTQLSLAIGKGGQNARLAAKLTGWKIDIKPLMNV